MAVKIPPTFSVDHDFDSPYGLRQLPVLVIALRAPAAQS